MPSSTAPTKAKATQIASTLIRWASSKGLSPLPLKWIERKAGAPVGKREFLCIAGEKFSVLCKRGQFGKKSNCKAAGLPKLGKEIGI